MAKLSVSDESHREAERKKWVQVCRKRAEMWRRTAEKNGSGPLHEEARARGNEAEFIADLIETDQTELGIVH